MEHPAIRQAIDEQENQKRRGATALAQSSGRDVNGQFPVLLAFHRFGRGKSMVLTTNATWRWRM